MGQGRASKLGAVLAQLLPRTGIAGNNAQQAQSIGNNSLQLLDIASFLPAGTPKR
jgi:hypothetical protein